MGVEEDTDLRYVSWRHKAIMDRAVEYGMRPGGFVVYFNAKRTLCRILMNLNGVRGIFCCEKDDDNRDRTIFDSIVRTLAAHAPRRFRNSLVKEADKLAKHVGK